VNPGLILGTRYTVTGPVNGSAVAGGIVPRDSGDIVFVGDTAAPVVRAVEPLGPTSIRLTFTEGL
jgi:hypothetical protein